MNIKEVPFQKEAITNLIRKTKMYIDEPNRVELLLTAPVASGKTVISGLYMDKMIEELQAINKTVGFIWISTGKGKLHTQSQNSMELFTKNIQVKSLFDCIRQEEIQPNDAMFLNWESVRMKDNIVRREDGGKSIQDCIQNTSVDYLIVLIDEAHESRNTPLAEEVLNMLNPNLIINITATPQNLTNFIAINTIQIDIKDVIQAGFIKKEIVVNKDVETTDRGHLLDSAIVKRNEIEEAFRERHITTVPLCLIQIENETQVETENGIISNAEEIKNMLIERGIDNSKIGIWVSDKTICQNLEDIKESTVEYLIFKQAIATGWDCPRSHILVRFREVKSISFDIQTIGRILRTITKEHFNNDVLDKAYIYTEYETIDFDVAIDNSFKKLIKTNDQLTTLKERIEWEKDIKLPMLKKNTRYIEMIDSEKVFNKLDTELYGLFSQLTIKEENLKTTKISGELATEEILREISTDKTVSVNDIDKVTTDLTESQINRLYKNILMTIYPKYSVGQYIPTLIRKHKQESISASDIKKLIVSNGIEIKFKIKQIVHELEKEAKISDSVEKEYQLPKDVYYSETKEAGYNYAYENEPVLSVKQTKSSTEEIFANYLNANPNISSWIKNGIGSNDFSVTYLEQDEEGNYIVKEYYPDFLIFSKTKRLYILDTKSKAGDKDFPNTRQKYNAGKQYEIKYKNDLIGQGIENIEFSIVKDFQGLFKVCTALNYNEDISSESWQILNIQ